MEHEDIPANKTHGIISGLGPYINATQRRAEVLTIAKYGRVAVQSSDGSLWIVIQSVAAPGTYVWKSIDNGTIEEVAGTPMTIITSVPVRLWLRADLGVTVATGVSHWVSQEGNSYDFAQATAGAQPARTATDSSLNNQTSITADGVDDSLQHGSMPMALTYWRCSVMKLNTWTLNRFLLSEPGGFGKGLALANVSPHVFLSDAGSFYDNPAPSALGAWKCYEEQQSNANTDYLTIGSSNVTGSTLGRNVATNGLSIASNAGASNAAASYAEIIITDGIPTPAEKTAIRSMLVARYFASLFT